ncbi:protein of unknown function [Polaribacter sp. Hel1_33_78]|jgi:hypothetical protein|uniref:DUF4959 domain-containing protein n=1 Tax=unclassified Polaribacter TaxID=196858 RepID=UPI00052C535C|nr:MULTISPECIES: DUF4959 domain-containing protein [unclassified Polaribacter]KGL59849.1 hypothetical protein PHEL49_0712 [Polaribacter sp. Hel1_33_49]PKV65760.1 uncharacterized protein DUF5126 [Polaribacter sp. Hel1_33_96]SDT90894.1 protein of unknown function [Polaribacter sp. Hel1_33_78]
MKKQINKVLLFSIFILATLIACSNNEDFDTTPPGILSNISVTPTNGGGIINYSLPSDDDILYVKAVYFNSQDEEVFRVSSKYNTFLEVNGLNQTSAVKVKLYVVDESENRSETVEIDFIPLKSFIFLVQESIAINPDLGGVKITWDNIASKTVFVYVHILDGANETIRILSSNNAQESIFIRGLASSELAFSTKVEDFDGNITELEEKGKYTPLFEEKIDKSTWTLVSGQSINGDAYEGRTVNFWDDVVDTVETDADNSYFIATRENNGGSLNFPLDIVIDFNKNVKIQRFKVWQRAFWYNGGGITYHYQEENIKSFNLYASSDSQTWNLLGQFDIGDPRDASGNIPTAAFQEAIDGHEFSLANTSEEFRYLKFEITSNYGSTQITVGSEITLFGLDNL